MPRNGSGIYSLPAGNPVTSGTPISSTVQNNTTADIATALTGSLASDGQTVPTANLPMGGFKHTNVANASAATEYAAFGQVLPLTGGTVSGATTFSNTLAVTGATTLSSTLAVTGNETVGGTLGVTGATTLTTLSASGAITPSQTAGIVGTTTNNNANAGSVGEEIRADIASGSAVSLVTGTPKTISSISLTAGDWDVTALVNFTLAASTSVTGLFGSISLTNNAVDVYQFSHRCAAFVPGAVDMGYTVPPRRLSISSTTTVYLVATAGFTVSTAAAWGFISARRRR